MANIIYKDVTSVIATKQENATFTTVVGSGLTFTFADRTNLTSKEANYFVSFNLPFEYDAFLSASTLAVSKPELFQLNVDDIVIVPIPREYYNELIDGRSITFNVPQFSGVTGISGKTIISSTYSHLTKKQSSALLGNNIAYLFADVINKPYTGTTNNGANSFSARTTWNVSPYTSRPYAISYTDVQNSDINTDQRPYSSITFANSMPSTYPTTTNQGYNYDIPVGFVALDKGFMVLTHPSIVREIPWTSGYRLITNAANTGPTSATTNIYFTDAVNSKATFYDLDISYKTSVVCVALPGEFYFSQNPTWNLTYNLQELNNETYGFDPVQVTEIGLYNKNNEMIAIAKIDRPVEKTYTNVITFTLDIDV